MAAFFLIVSLSLGTSFVIYRQTRQHFSIVFLVVLLTLFCLTKKRIQHLEINS
jgi:hypothetical protein